VIKMCRVSIFLAAQVVIISLAPIVGSAQSTATTLGESLGFGPNKTTLIGRLIIETRFGPPNYGEAPLTDKKVKIYILRLSTPITVPQLEGKQANVPVQKVELFFSTRQGPFGWDAAHRAIGKCFSVVGTVFAFPSGYRIYAINRERRQIRDSYRRFAVSRLHCNRPLRARWAPSNVTFG
jgi:hypothetical protein